VRDQWHTMTRTGRSVALGSHRSVPFVEVHPLDAAVHGLKHDGFARVRTRHGACILKVVVAEGQRRGSIFAPIHWSDETASSARVGDLVAPDTDPISGQPESKATPAGLERIEFRFEGFALGRRPLCLPRGTWWARVALAEGDGYLFASDDGPLGWHAIAPGLFGEDAVLTQYVDRGRGIYRAAAFLGGELAGAVFLHRAGAGTGRPALADAPGHGFEQIPQLGTMPVLCACFGVGLKTIRDAMASRSAPSVEEIGRFLRAGTRCGSCLPELRSMANERLAQAV
jgi:assimilatory nitrate reductase catalytic subunit